MTRSRLNLNWELIFRTDRLAYAQSYLDSIPFTPTEDELETISNYILWGKTDPTQKNGAARLKEEGIFLESKWNGSVPVESLDELIESPAFTENDIKPISSLAPKRVREVFSRSEARKLASPELLKELESLWSLIDETELTLNFYEAAHQLRKNPPRQELLNLDNDAIELAKSRASSLNQRSFLKLKHQLIELRQQQYNFQDSYRHTITPLKLRPYQELGGNPEFGNEIQILPLGLKTNANAKFFQEGIDPNSFGEEDLKLLSSLIWMKRAPSKQFDFRETDHLRALFGMWEELEAQAEESDSIRLFLDTAKFYIEMADLSEMEKLILEKKIKKESNQAIQLEIKKKFGHLYELNYISTLFCKKILEKIGNAASYHKEVCENLMFPENFKKCKDCGRWLLLDERGWVRRKRSKDGFSPRCKRCEKIKRIRATK